jgi:LEA14-like dessication related protein
MVRGALFFFVLIGCAHPAPAPRTEKPAAKAAPPCYGFLTEVQLAPLAIEDGESSWDDLNLVARFRVDNPTERPVTLHDWNGAIASIEGLQATQIDNLPVTVQAHSCDEVRLRLTVRYTHALHTVTLVRDLELRVSPKADDGPPLEVRVTGRPRLRQSPEVKLGTIEVTRNRGSADVMFPFELLNPNVFPMKLESAELTPYVFNNPLRKTTLGPAALSPGERYPYKIQVRVDYDAVNGLASTPLHDGSLEISVDLKGTLVIDGHPFPIATGNINNARYLR